jgi:hypothetical protein
MRRLSTRSRTCFCLIARLPGHKKPAHPSPHTVGPHAAPKNQSFASIVKTETSFVRVLGTNRTEQECLSAPIKRRSP